MKNKIISLIFVCLTLFSSPVLANEVINSYDSLIEVMTDGSMVVTETITVHHEGYKIRRGIYRDLSTKKGEKYELIGVKRNGNPEPSFVERVAGYYRINTGNDNYLPHQGTSTFEIKYKVWNVPRSYEGYDEVYWNVTGNKWEFQIENVSARVKLPVGADIIQQASYIGYDGSKEQAIYEGDGQYRGRHLYLGEQLTIAVGFMPGVVSTKRHTSVMQMGLPIVYIIYLLFLIWAWHKKGRDPAGRAIMPQYEPPKELTAAEAACLYDKGAKKNLLAISFIQMISNGFLKLTVVTKKAILGFSDKEYVLEKTDKTPSNPEESSFHWKKKVIVYGKYDGSLETEGQRLREKTEKGMKNYYTKNHKWVVLPTLLMILIAVFCCLDDVYMLSASFDAPMYYIVGGIVLLIILFSTCFTVQRTMLMQIVAFLWGSVFLMVLLFVALADELQSFLYIATTLFAIGLSASIFTFLLYQPTEKGQRLIEHLEGLKMFLKTTKLPTKEKLKIEEKLKPENMEKLFPYAMALGLEKEWEAKFKGLFGITEYNKFTDRHPYTATTFVRTFSSSMTSSNSKSGSGFSGSGGGGFSGGGFGGGGGGGR